MESAEENSPKMVHQKKQVSDTISSHSDDNVNMENTSCNSTSTKNSAYFTLVTDENSSKYKRNLMLNQMQCKKRKSSTAENLKENATTCEELDEIAEIEENQPMHSYEKNSPEVINMTNKEVIRLSKSTLYPEIPSFSTRDRPSGCKAIFVNGLPQKITEAIIKEIFGRCGSLEAIRMQKKGICYISFNEESSVENAVCFSGYRLKIDNKNETPFSGILYVDYAKAEFDQNCSKQSQSVDNSVISICPTFSMYETGTLVKKLQNEDEQESQPKEMIQFSTENAVSNINLEHTEGRNEDDHIATSCICESLKKEENFPDGASIIMMWLEKEESTKENANSFFTMMQCIHKHVVNIHRKINEYEEQLKNTRGILIEHLNKIMLSLSKIVNIYTAVLLEKWLNHFTSEQRNNIEQCQKYAEELRSDIKEKIDELEDEVKADAEHVKYFKQLEVKIKKLQESKNNLQQQCKEVQNKIASMDKNIAAIQSSLQNSQKEVCRLKRRCSMNEVQIQELYKIAHKKQIESRTVPAEEARIIALTSSFLQIWRGANIDSICFYLHEADPTINCGIVESLMRRFSTVFQEVVTGIGANMTKKWYLRGFPT